MRIVFSTYGSLGDVYPFLAIAQELRKHGVTCDFVTNHSNVEAVQASGFQAYGVVTDAIKLFERAGLEGEEAIDATRNSIAKFWQIVMPEFSNHLDKVDDIVGDAALIIGPPWAFNAQSVAEKKNIPFIGAHLWPLGFLSAYDPPILRDIYGLIRPPKSKAAVAWNRFIIHCSKQVMKLMFARYLNQPRRAYGLRPLTNTPVLDFQLTPTRILGLYSAHFAPAAADMPAQAQLTGFPFFNDNFDATDPELDDFMEQAPVVFTLGSIISENPGSFYHHSVAAVEQLGIKAVLLTKDPTQVPTHPNLLVRGYVPHAKVFPKASINVHHGGIGTTAQALMAGKPQLIVPHFGDQFDNAVRLEKLGVARAISAPNYAPQTAVSALADMLSSPDFDQRAQTLGAKIQTENGAKRAAQTVLDAINHT